MKERPGSLVVSIIVPIHHAADTFTLCLVSLLPAVSYPHELIVVADGPAPELTRLARQCRVKVVQLAQAGGPARARNRGAAEAKGDILLFIDSDVLVPPDIIKHVVAEFERDASLTALIGSYDSKPTAPNFLSQYRNLLHHYTHQNSAIDIKTFWAGCGAVRCQPFRAVGGFDEAFTQPAIEDIELGYRLTAAGYAIRIVKSLQVTHLKTWRLYTMLSTDFWQRALPWTRLLLRQPQFENNLNIDTRGRISVALFYLVLLLLPLLYFWPIIGVAAAGILLLLLGVNQHFYHFLYKERGLLFATTAVPYHWLYFGYSGLAFVLGNLQNYFQVITQRRALKTGPSMRLSDKYRRISLGEKSAR
jgi:GT2 family glycosyltransferase